MNPPTAPAPQIKKQRLILSRLRQSLDRFIFASLLALIVLTAIPYGTVEPWWEALFEACVFGLGALSVIEAEFVSRHRRATLPHLLLPLSSSVLLIFLQMVPLYLPSLAAGGVSWRWTVISEDPHETWRVFIKFSALVLSLGLLIRHTTNKGRYQALVYTLVGIGFISALFGLARHAVQGEAYGFVLPYLNSGYGQFINPNHFSLLMEMTFGLLLGLTFGGGIRRSHILVYLAVAVIVWTALVLSGSRGGILSMIGQAVFFAALVISSSASRHRAAGAAGAVQAGAWQRIGGSRVFQIALLSALSLALLLGVVWLGGDLVADRMESVQDEFDVKVENKYAHTRRLEIWDATWHLIKDEPLKGVGFGSYWTAITKYHQGSGELSPYQAHNDYLELMAGGGVIAIALCCWFISAIIRDARAQLLCADAFTRAVTFGALSSLVAVALHSFVDFGLHITINALVFFGLLATIATRYRTERPNDLLKKLKVQKQPVLHVKYSRVRSRWQI